jgi:rubrerythrin
VLNALQELDFDNTLNKIPEEDYPVQRAALVKKGADIYRQLDALQEVNTLPTDEPAEQRVEAVLAARRGAGSTVGEPSSTASEDDSLEAMLAQRRRARQDKAAGFCPKCGSALQKSDRFCPKCGTSV